MTAFAVIALRWGPYGGAERRWACWGVGLAWLAASCGSALLAFGLAGGPQRFWRSFGAGVAMRAGVLFALVWRTWQRPQAPAVLGGYVFWLAVLLLVEFRHLVRRAP